MTDLPPPPPMTSDEIISHLADWWLENIGGSVTEAGIRAHLSFVNRLLAGTYREWGFDSRGNMLYEPHIPETIVYVLVPKEE